MKRLFIYILLAAQVLTLASGCAAKAAGSEKYQTEFYDTFDTVVIVLAYTQSQEEFDALADTVHSRMLFLHQLFDIYHNYDGINNLKTINDNAGIKPVKVNEEIISLLKEARDWYHKTDGIVNVAMGAVLAVWHDYREAGILDEATAKLPPQQALEDAARYTDISNLIIDEAESTVYLADSAMRLDVGAIAKGYATEAVADGLIAKGYDSVLISAGGNIRAIGAPKNGTRDRWSVGITDPEMSSDTAVPSQKLLDVAYVNDMSVVSSGGYERYYMVEGVPYHHLIDPETLYPANYYQAVTVLTEDSSAADALSTALFLMPPDKALKFAESLGDVEALWVMPDDTLMLTDGVKPLLRDLGNAS
jgi:thiamine biosynthesis lipoprotein